MTAVEIRLRRIRHDEHEAPDSGANAAIRRAVEAGFEAQTRFLAELVAIPSVRGQEAPAQDMMEAALRERGYAVDAWTIDPAALAPSRLRSGHA